MSREQWEELIRSSVKRDPENLAWDTPEGFAVEPIYWPEDVDAGSPLMAPAAHLSRRTIDLRQDIQVIEINVARQRALDALEGGCDAIGFRTSNRTSELCLESLPRLLDGLPLERVPVHFVAHPSFSALILAFLRQIDVPSSTLQCSILFDPFAAGLGEGRAPDAAQIKYAGDLLRSFDDVAPGCRCLGIDGAFYAETGANLTWQIAAILATASEYLAGLTDMSIPAIRIINRMHIRFASGISYFFGIAALRVLRSLQKDVYAAYLPDDESIPEPYLHVETSRFFGTACEPTTNLLRHTTEAAAAIIGGCDSLSIYPHEPGIESDASLRYARNLGLVLRHEAFLDRVADPSRGAYYIEHLTRQLAQSAWSAFQMIEGEGGLSASIRNGSIQRAIHSSRTRTVADIRSGRQAIIGTNRYPDPWDE